CLDMVAVIKIEPPAGDLARTIPPYFFQGDSAFFHSVNRNKKSVVLDLKSRPGREAFYDLVRVSDVVSDNFAPDVPERLGVDHTSLSRINPRIVSCSLYGFHDEGEYRNAPAFDGLVQAMGGVMSITGEPGGEPARVGYQIGDLAGGLFAALATVAALREREVTGRGRHVHVSLYDSQLSLLTWQAQNYLISGHIPGPAGSRHPTIVPSQAFKTADGRYLVISPTGEKFWTAFCQALGHPELSTEPRFNSAAARLENEPELERILAELLISRPLGEWMEIFQRERVPAAPVQNVAEALSHHLVALRNMVVSVPRPPGGELRLVGNPMKTESEERFTAPPKLGQDTEEVLRRLVGYTPEQIAAVVAGSSKEPVAGVANAENGREATLHR
ncbi:MAG: CoA transferase, partial [Actinobacteria bacterium]|nr:CoA transferase [Actinomycetota bacterium]